MQVNCHRVVSHISCLFCPDLLTQVMFDEEYKSWSSLLQLENVTSSSLGPHHPVLEFHQLIFFPKYERTGFYTHN